MTPAEFKESRATLGLSASRMAAALGLADGRIIRRYESGEVRVTGPVSLLMRLYLYDPKLMRFSR